MKLNFKWNLKAYSQVLLFCYIYQTCQQVIKLFDNKYHNVLYVGGITMKTIWKSEKQQHSFSKLRAHLLELAVHRSMCNNIYFGHV